MLPASFRIEQKKLIFLYKLVTIVVFFVIIK